MACELITELYQCTKLTQSQFHQLLTLPNGVNEYAKKALVKLNEADIAAIVNKASSDSTSKQKRLQLIRVLETFSAQKISKHLEKLTIHELRLLCCVDNWTLKENYLKILYLLSEKKFNEYINIFSSQDKLTVLSLCHETLNSIKDDNLRNWLLSYYHKNEPTTFSKQLKLFSNNIISNWLTSLDFEQLKNLIFNSEFKDSVKFISSLIETNTDFTEQEDDDMCVIHHQKEGKTNTVLCSLAEDSLTCIKHKSMWVAILKKIGNANLEQLWQICLTKSPLSLPIGVLTPTHQKFIADWFEGLSEGVRLNVLSSQTSEGNILLFQVLVNQSPAKAVKLLPPVFLKAAIGDQPTSYIQTLLKKITTNHLKGSYQDQRHLELVKPLLTKLSTSESALKRYLEDLTKHLDKPKMCARMKQLPSEVTLIMFERMDGADKQQVIPDSEFKDASSITYWCNVLPEKYILQRVSASNSLTVLSEILKNEQVSPKLKTKIISTISDEQFDKLVTKYAFGICTHIQCFSPERILKIRQNLNFQDWKIVAKRIPSKNLKLWIDWDSELQAEYWISKCGPEYIFDLYQTLSVSQSHKLMNFIPISHLAVLLTQICKEMSYEEAQAFIEHNAAHSKMPILMSEWYNCSYLHCEKTIKLLPDLSEDNKKLFLEYLSKRQFFEICKVLSKISVSVKKGQLLSIYRCRYSAASNKIKKAFRHHKNTLISRTQNSVPLTTEIQGTNTIYYHSEQRIHPPLRLPDEKNLQNKHKAKGAFKSVTKSDGQYVSMRVTEIKTDPVTRKKLAIDKPKPPQGHELTEAQIELFQELKKSKVPPESSALNSGALGVLINDGDSIAADAGVDLTKYLDKDTRIDDISQLLYLCKTIDFAHNRGFYFRDLKLENILFKKYVTRQDGTLVKLPSPKLTIIDLDDLCRIERLPTSEYRIVGDRIKWCSTPGYITHRLQENKLTGNTKWLLATDKYSICLCMLYMLDSKILLFPTRPEAQMQSSNQRVPKYYWYHVPPKYHRYNKNGIFYHGHLHHNNISSEQQKHAKAIISKYVKPDYQAQFFNFLCDPVSHCLPDKLTLEEIFNWQADKES